MSNGLFLAAFACSGLASLIYQTTWTRLLTLYMGHSTAAASTVLAAFIGGLGGGAALGGYVARRLSPRRSLDAYVGLEAVVVLAAIALPFALEGLIPLLAWAYQDGTSPVIFPAARLASCFVLVSIPALALGATFPMAVRWFAATAAHAGRATGALYAANTAGATAGVLLAGFVTFPAIGNSGTTGLGILASALAIGGVVVVAWRSERPGLSAPHAGQSGLPEPTRRTPRRADRSQQPPRAPERPRAEQPWLAAMVLAITGVSTMVYEVVWIRMLALITGPTTYAFAATVAAAIGGLACGSAFGAWLAGRARWPALWLACALGGSALVTAWTTAFVGTEVPLRIAESAVRSLTAAMSPATVMLVAVLILPTAIGLGIAFPLAVEVAGGHGEDVAWRVGSVYAVNTLAAIVGALGAGFVAVPAWGLQGTLDLVSMLLAAGAVLVIGGGRLPRRLQAAGLVPVAVAAVVLIGNPSWDREVLASGVYRYAAAAPAGVDLEPLLKAGTLLYYREGSASTVSVRELAGARSMAIDGKVDASTSGDMLTQKALAHLPLLLHPDPRDVLIIGLGSGVTLASALVHPIERADTLEISPEVVAASAYFAPENRNALRDPRARLIMGDGRSHLNLSSRQYDVIISEPSNPWMAGVAALFTREFFTTARSRLAPGGIICQWAHTYDITDADLRSIVATFRSVFPEGTIWSIGRGDLLLVASIEPLDGYLANLSRRWKAPAVAADLLSASAFEPFAFLSLFAGGPHELAEYARGAPLQVDDRLALEFSGPRAVNLDTLDENARRIAELGGHANAPAEVRDALATAGAAEWRNRGAMMASAADYVTAYEDYARAIALDPADEDALDGLIRTAAAVGRQGDALTRLEVWLRERPHCLRIKVAASRLLAGTGDFDGAITMITDAIDHEQNGSALEQLASLFSDLGDAAGLGATVARLEQLQPEAPKTAYYAAVGRFFGGDLDGALIRARDAADRDPKYAAAHNLLGTIHATLKQEESARAAFQTARRLNPRDSAVFLNLGLLELAAGNGPDAASYFTEALLLDPGSAAAREGLNQARPSTHNRPWR